MELKEYKKWRNQKVWELGTKYSPEAISQRLTIDENLVRTILKMKGIKKIKQSKALSEDLKTNNYGRRKSAYQIK